MADTYTILAQREDIEFLGGTLTRPVVSVSFQTKPHNIYAEFRIPRKDYLPRAVGAGALSYAAIYEGIAALDFVVGVQWSQVVTAASELADNVTITVASSSGNSTASLDVLLNALGPDLHAAQISALHDQLDNAESL